MITVSVISVYLFVQCLTKPTNTFSQGQIYGYLNISVFCMFLTVMIKCCVQFVNYLYLKLSETLIIFCSDNKNIASHVRSCEVWSVLSEVCLSHQSVIISPVSQIIPKHYLCTLSKGAFSKHQHHPRLLKQALQRVLRSQQEECTGDRYYTQNQFTVQVFIKLVYSTQDINRD